MEDCHNISELYSNILLGSEQDDDKCIDVERSLAMDATIQTRVKLKNNDR